MPIAHLFIAWPWKCLRPNSSCTDLWTHWINNIYIYISCHPCFDLLENVISHPRLENFANHFSIFQPSLHHFCRNCPMPIQGPHRLCRDFHSGLRASDTRLVCQGASRYWKPVGWEKNVADYTFVACWETISIDWLDWLNQSLDVFGWWLGD